MCVHLRGVMSLWCMHWLEIKVTKISFENYCCGKIRQVVHPRLYCIFVIGPLDPLVYSPPGSRDFPVLSSPWSRSGTPGSHFSNF
jgi:hypothetical protein